MEWMIHTAKVSAQDSGDQVVKWKRAKNRDHFRTATFGYIDVPLESVEAGPRRPSLAQVYTTKPQSSGASLCNNRGVLEGAPLQHTIFTDNGKGEIHSDEKLKLNDIQNASSQVSHNTVEVIVSSADENPHSFSGEHNPNLGRNALSTRMSRKSSGGTLLNAEAASSKSSFRSIVRETKEVDEAKR